MPRAVGDVRQRLPIDSPSLEQFLPRRCSNPAQSIVATHALSASWHIASCRCAATLAIEGVVDIEQAVPSRVLVLPEPRKPIRRQRRIPRRRLQIPVAQVMG